MSAILHLQDQTYKIQQIQLLILSDEMHVA